VIKITCSAVPRPINTYHRRGGINSLFFEQGIKLGSFPTRITRVVGDMVYRDTVIFPNSSTNVGFVKQIFPFTRLTYPAGAATSQIRFNDHYGNKLLALSLK
jgi:hypothetical protein